eukprot:Skav226724  [mRNA]  locus=scaffold720:14695:16275:- [translate_table: standard]
MKKQKTVLDIPIRMFTCSGVEVPMISPQSWLKFIVDHGLWPLTAGCAIHDYDGARRSWSEFWRLYELVDPGCDVFQLELDLSRTAAFFIHGDEGRTLKRGGILVTSLQSALGRGYDQDRVATRVVGDSPNLQVNFSGHSFTTRYVVSAIPKTHYEAEPAVFHSAIEHLAVSCQKLRTDGYVDASRHEHFRVVILGVKGDAPYLAKVGHFYRSYNTTAKRGEQQGPAKGVCPYCLAGTDAFPAEELATSEPRWRSTVGVKLPWLRQPSLIRYLIHNRGHPAGFFKSDIWHIVHLGFGLSWVASIIQLVLPCLRCDNLEQKWDWLTLDYQTWCSANRKQTHISKISPYLMSYNDHSGCMGNWHKGMLTTNFLLWLVDLLGRVRADPDGLLNQCRMTTYRLNAMFGVLYRSGAFLSEDEASFVSTQGLLFLKVYSEMAERMFRASRQWMFPLFPKLHSFHHLMLDVRDQGEQAKVAASPMLHCCQMDEDTVGRTSRISRRVSIRQASYRTLTRYLAACHAAHVKAGLLH